MIKTKKKFGQNFLIDKEIIYKIIDYIKPKEQDKILEIGPGMGALTQPMLGKISHMTVVEIDPDMINYLQKKISKKNLNIIDQDILSLPTEELILFDRIIGNLPYYISTEILIKMIEVKKTIKDFHFMFQREVAERITAQANNKNYGRLSVIIQYFFDAEILFNITPDSFLPSPKVQSSFIKLIPKEKKGIKFRNFLNFTQVIKTAFQFKRKTIRNNFKNILSEENFIFLDIKSHNRAEALSIDDFVKIENYIFDNKIII
jgi:16S rRNA (adenine1518-N6/adenine1519-N6)-dimethyltransferase